MSSSASRLKIFQALTAENPPPIPFSDDTVTLSDPVVSVDPQPGCGDEWNTKVTVTAKPGSGYSGSVDVYYRRSNLQKFLGTNVLIQECRFTPESIIAALNSCYNSFLSLDDLEPIDPANLPCHAGVLRCLELTALDNSLGWFGVVRVPVVIGIPAQADKLHHLIHTVMPAANYW